MATDPAGGWAQQPDDDVAGVPVGSCLINKVDAARLHAAAKGRRSRWRNFLYGMRPEPIPAFRGPIDDPDPDRLGICCSGGGVRSAAFNLGALQALQERDELRHADYLAAVSGGSYIAAAFAMVAKCWRGHDRPDAGEPGHDDSDPELVTAAKPPFRPGSPEEQYLRNRSSYLAPTGTDKLYLVYRLILGVAFNFVFLALPLFGIAMVLGATVYTPVFAHLSGGCAAHCSAAPPLYLWIPPAALGAMSAGAGMGALLLPITGDRLASLLRVWSTRLLMLGAVVAWITVALPVIIAALNASGTTPAAGRSGIAGSAGLIGIVAGVVAQVRETIVTPKRLAADASRVRQWWGKASSLARRIVAYTVAAVVGPALFLGVTVLGAAIAVEHSRHPSVNLWLVVEGLGAVVAFAALYACVDLTSWSLHPFYKRRLCTAFALKRVRPSQLPDEDGYAERVVPQAEAEGIAVERDFDELVKLSETGLDHDQWPVLLVCAAANVSDPGATPPGRRVTSFTFSANEIGGPLVGGVRTSAFEDAVADANRKRAGDCSLPAAVAMSGAALSPSMGKLTRAPLRFLLALANVRLGVWVPNPRVVAARELTGRTRKGWVRRYGRARPSYLLRELIGRNRVDARYLYVTDGGHYENLGLVELLRRGCTEVYCFDASGGEDFKVLGDAIALARSELGVEISIDPSRLTPGGDGIALANAVRGTFAYPAPDGGAPVEGTLVYARNVMTAAAPWDVKTYHAVDPSFPHDPTFDQVYSDQRFEAYRALGFGAGARAVALMRRPLPAGRNGHQLAGPPMPA